MPTGVLLIILAVSAIVLGVVVTRAIRQIEAEPKRPLDDAMLLDIDGFVQQGVPIRAIKVLRDGTGLGLAEAKHRVDNWDLARERAALHGEL